MPRGRTEDEVFRDDERRSLSNHLTPRRFTIHETPTAPKIFSDEGSKVRRLREEYFTTSRRLQERGSEKPLEERGDEIWRQIDDIVHTVTRRVVEYADQFEDGVGDDSVEDGAVASRSSPPSELRSETDLTQPQDTPTEGETHPTTFARQYLASHQDAERLDTLENDAY